MSVEVFISYDEADDSARRALEAHLSNLQRNGLVRIWAANQIGAGQHRRAVIDGHLESARLILLLISPDYFASNECHDLEMRRAIERHRSGSAHVVPIIIRYVHWRGAPFDGLSVLPDSSRPVDSPAWGTTDKAWTNVVGHLSALVDEMLGRRPSGASPAGKSFVEAHGGRFSTPGPQPAPPVAPHSSRAPFSSNPSSLRALTHSQPEIASPVSAPRPSQQPAPWTAAPLTARSPRARGQSLPVILAALGVAVAGMGVGGWKLLQQDEPNAPTIDLPMAPAVTARPSPTAASAPAPYFAGVTPAKGTPAKGTPAKRTGPCCGGSECAAPFQDAQESICDPKKGSVCATCSSSRTRVEWPCRFPLEASERFYLRLANVAFKSWNPAAPRLCVRLEGEPPSARQCTAASDGSDVPERVPGADLVNRLPVSIADLIDNGRGLTVEVEAGGVFYLVRSAATVPGPLLRSVLCRGLIFKLERATVSFYLDDI